MTGRPLLEQSSEAAQTPWSLLTTAFDYFRVPYELIPHKPTQTALAEARAVGVEPDEVAKTILLATPNGYLRAVLPASCRLDLGKVRRLLATDDVLLASEEMLAYDYPEFDLGAVPPVGGNRVDAVLVDRCTIAREWAIFEAGVHDRSIRVKSVALAAIAEARVVDICDRLSER